jgi:hypothetical protein
VVEVNFYKAVREDGTSFYDPTFRWCGPPGEPLPTEPVVHPATGGLGYLSASVSATDCTGMQWPCRLLTVEPVGETFTPDASALPNKRAAKAFRVTGEVESWRALGPNGEIVAALIDRASRLTLSEAKALAATWYSTWYATWYAAWDAARYAAWYATWDAARYAAWDAARAAARDAAWDAARDATRYAARDAAWDAARAAAWALIARDLITPEQFDLLYGPWASVIETAEVSS